MDNSLGGVNWIGFIPLGAALLWSFSVLTRRNRMGSDTLLAIKCAGWILVWLGMLGPILTLAGGPVIAIVLLVIAAMTVHRYREAERRSLVWLIGSTARCGLPLVPVVRAFARERTDEIGHRVEHLARLLEQGLNLTEALIQSGNRLPDDAMLAVGMSEGQLDFGQLLAETSRQRAELMPEWSSFLTLLYYLLVSCAVLLGVNAYIMLAIVPTLRQITLDFETPWPESMAACVAFADWFAQFGIFLLPVVVLALLTCLVIGTFYYIGWLTWTPPPLRRIVLRYHGSIVLRTLAYYVKADIPLTYGLTQIAVRYPRRFVRLELKAVADEVAAGRPWYTSLREHNFLGPTEAGVLQAAADVGNVAWALREMSERSLRTMAFRLRLALRFIIPLAVILLALPIASVAYAIFELMTTLTLQLA